MFLNECIRIILALTHRYKKKEVNGDHFLDTNRKLDDVPG